MIAILVPWRRFGRRGFCGSLSGNSELETERGNYTEYAHDHPSISPSLQM